MRRLIVILLIIIVFIVPLSVFAIDYVIDNESGLKLYVLPNGVSDEVVDGKLIKRVSDEFTLPMSDWRFVTNNEHGFVVIVNYTNFPNFASKEYGEFIPTNGMVVNNSNLPAYTTTYYGAIRDNANAECIATGYHSGTNIYIVIHQDNYNETQDYEGANAWVNENMQGVTLNYELETPIEYNINPIIGQNKVKLLINEFSTHIKNIGLAVGKTVTEFFYDGEAITARGILFFAYVATVFCLSVLAIVFKRR